MDCWPIYLVNRILLFLPLNTIKLHALTNLFYLFITKILFIKIVILKFYRIYKIIKNTKINFYNINILS